MFGNIKKQKATFVKNVILSQDFTINVYIFRINIKLISMTFMAARTNIF